MSKELYLKAYTFSITDNNNCLLVKPSKDLNKILLLSKYISDLRRYLLFNRHKISIDPTALEELSEVFSIIPQKGFLANDDYETSLAIINNWLPEIRRNNKELYKILAKITKLIKVLNNISICKDIDIYLSSLLLEKKSLHNTASYISKVADCYRVGPYIINILHDLLSERIYLVKPIVLHDNISILFVKNIQKHFSEIIPANVFVNKTDLLIDYIKRLCKKFFQIDFIDLNIKLNDYINDLSEYLSYRILGLHKLMPLLMDRYVQEIYLDGADTFVYLDHLKYGRCTTNIKLSRRDAEYLITRLKIETGDIIDENNPSLKAELITKKFSVRISIDISPLAVDGVVIDIRRHNPSLCTLHELVKMNMLSSYLANYLKLCMKYRPNLMIVGEPGSGKTTLLNALDREVPSFFRKIYLEDVVESIRVLNKTHQARYKVYPIDSAKYKGKELEVTKLLHRHPDYIILGEIQSKDQFRAVFLALSAGLKCAFTCHSDSLIKLLRRVIENYGISRNLLSLIDIIIFTKKSYNSHQILRYIDKVYETSHYKSKAFIKIYDRNISEKLLVYPTPFLNKVNGEKEYVNNY